MTEPHQDAGPWWLGANLSDPAGAPPAGQPARRNLSSRAWVKTAAVLVTVLGIAIGLLVARPWQSPPLLAPVALNWGPATASSVRVSWQVAPGSLRPDGFLILRDGRRVALMSGQALSYVDRGLVPGASYAYKVIATSGEQRSRASYRVVAATFAPAPANLTQTGKDWTSVTLTWSPPPQAPAPDRYEVIDESRYGTIIASVPGGVHSYTVPHLSPGASGRYDVDAVWSGHHSPATPAITAAARVAPLDHDYAVTYTTVVVPGKGASLHAGQKWTDRWTFSPVCAGARCAAMKAQINFDPPNYLQKEINLTLRLNQGSYVGTTKARLTTCGGVPSPSPLISSDDPPTVVTNTITMVIAPDKMRGGAWTAWHAAIQLSSPDTIHYSLLDSDAVECLPQSWYFTVAGHRPAGE